MYSNMATQLSELSAISSGV